MKKSLSIFLIVAVVLVSGLTLSAQAKPLDDPVPTATPDPHTRLVSQPNASESANSETAGVSPQAVCTNLIGDPSFETGRFTNTSWFEYSYNFGTPLCTIAACGTGGGTARPRTGNVWGWFGGTTAITETAQVWQPVIIPTDTATLSFYLWIGYAGSGSSANDVFYAGFDGIRVFTATALNASSYITYTLVTLNASPFADGISHDVLFEAYTSIQPVTFNLDDVSLCSFVATSKVYLPSLRR